MSDHSFTEVTHHSWGSRVKNAVAGVVFGLLLFTLAFPLLFWNEGRAVKRARSLDEGQDAVVEGVASPVDSGLDGAVVHLSHDVTCDETLSDPTFGVAVKALRLDRQVEMYQWDESKSTSKQGRNSSSTTYSYSKTWSSSLINSGSFRERDGHENPKTMAHSSRTELAKDVRLGDLMLARELVRKIRPGEPITVDDEFLLKLPEKMRTQAHALGDRLYLGEDPDAPQIGDVRIQFRAAAPARLSIVAQQTGATLAPYLAEAGDEIALVAVGDVTADRLFEQARVENTILTWVLRGAGFGMMFVGILLLFQPIGAVASFLPVLGDVVQLGAALVALVLAGVFTIGTIGLGWLTYRPLIGLPLLAAAIALVVGLLMRARARKGRLSGAQAATLRKAAN